MAAAGQHICDMWIRISERFAAIYGEPLPKRLLSLGNDRHGWGVKLNATHETVGDIAPYVASVTWCGFAAGIISPVGGSLSYGSLANDATFREWLPEAEK